MPRIILTITATLLITAAPALGQGNIRLPADVHTAINRGLEYLARAQDEQRGNWSNGRHPTANTSLALMAFMLQGHVPGRGPYGEVMDRGITFLLERARAHNGYMGTPQGNGGMYEHGLATLCLSEAWGQSKRPEIRLILQRAVDVILRSQNYQGGWRYEPQPKSADLSVTVMQIVALASAKEAGIAVPDKTLHDAVEYVKACHDETTGGFNYQPGNSKPGFARTAAGVMSLMMTGNRNINEARRGLSFLMQYPTPQAYETGADYGRYYAAQVMYQAGDAAFKPFYDEISDWLLERQEDGGNWRGSHGRAYGTSMAILVLGVPYRYLPIYQR